MSEEKREENVDKTDVPFEPTPWITSCPKQRTYQVIEETDMYFIFKDDKGQPAVADKSDCRIQAISLIR